MTKTQRTILFALPLQALLIFIFFYMTPYWVVGIIMQAGLTLLLMRRLLTAGNSLVIVAKSLHPFMFVSVLSLYNLLLAQICGISIPVFAVQTLVASILYGLFCFVVLRSKLPVWAASSLTLLQVGLMVNFLAIAMAYWRVPSFIVLPIAFVAIGYYVLWWLLEIRRPQDALLLLAASFGLIATELVWAYSRWVIVYQLPVVNVIVTQVAVIVAALAYGLGGIHLHRSAKPVKLGIVVEYMLVFAVVFLATFLSTRWVNGL